MRRVFTVEDEECVSVCWCREESLGQLLLVTKVHCTLDVPTIVLVFETAIDDGFLVVQVIISTVKYLDERCMVNTRKALRLRGREVGQFERRGLICVHHRL